LQLPVFVVVLLGLLLLLQVLVHFAECVQFRVEFGRERLFALHVAGHKHDVLSHLLAVGGVDAALHTLEEADQVVLVDVADQVRVLHALAKLVDFLAAPLADSFD